VSVERLAGEVLDRLRAEIAAAGGREVSFVAAVGADGAIRTARVAARGTVDAVLALPGIAGRGEMLLHNHPSGVLDPSGADLHVAARLHDAGVGVGIVDNDVARLYVVVEVPRAREAERLDPVAVAALLGRDGPVARGLGAFEDRPSQRDMAAYIADVYNDGGIALLEAGTGVGKSFAYLVPAFEWAARNGERTVVSTNTINLQEQLVGKDLPILAGCWGMATARRRTRCSKGGATTCVSRGSSRRAGGRSRCSKTSARRNSTRWPRGRPARATAASPTWPRSRRPRCGTPWPPSRTCARGSSARTSTAASCSRRAAAPPRRTWWS
jgi:ATP-dependent DNA helicase DinG